MKLNAMDRPGSKIVNSVPSTVAASPPMVAAPDTVRSSSLSAALSLRAVSINDPDASVLPAGMLIVNWLLAWSVQASSEVAGHAAANVAPFCAPANVAVTPVAAVNAEVDPRKRAVTPIR